MGPAVTKMIRWLENSTKEERVMEFGLFSLKKI